MKEEVSAGIILFNDNEDRKFLLLNYPSKHWDFVKGKMEKDETPHAVSYTHLTLPTIYSV